MGRGVGGRIVVLRLADTIRCGADIIPCVHVCMIRILITRVFSSGRVTSQFSTPYPQMPRNDTPVGGGANGTWVTLYYQDMGYSSRRRAAGFLPLGNA